MQDDSGGGEPPLSVFSVTEPSDVTRVCRAAKELAESRGFAPSLVYQIVTCVSELASNLVAHTHRGGHVTLSMVAKPPSASAPDIDAPDIDAAGTVRMGIEIITQDDGPGIDDVALAMQDGYSTAGTLGGGLPGARRLMHEFTIQSEVGVGTQITVRKWLPCK